VRLEESGKLKKKIFTSPGLEPATFRLAAQCPNHYAQCLCIIPANSVCGCNANFRVKTAFCFQQNWILDVVQSNQTCIYTRIQLYFKGVVFRWLTFWLTNPYEWVKATVYISSSLCNSTRVLRSNNGHSFSAISSRSVLRLRRTEVGVKTRATTRNQSFFYMIHLETEEFCLMRHNAVYSTINQPMFRGNAASNFSESKKFRFLLHAGYSTVKMEAKCPSETLIDFQRAAWRYIPENGTLLKHRLKSQIHLEIVFNAGWITVTKSTDHFRSDGNASHLTSHLGWDHKKQSCLRNRPWRPIRLWDVKNPKLSRHSAHRWWSGCQPHASAALYFPETLLF
jgi:hypothetical protein